MVSFSTPAHITEKSTEGPDRAHGEEKQKIDVHWELREGERARLTLSLGERSVTAEGAVCERAEKAPLTAGAYRSDRRNCSSA